MSESPTLYFLGHFNWPVANLHDSTAYWTCDTNHLGEWTILKSNIIKQVILNVLFIGKLLFIKFTLCFTPSLEQLNSECSDLCSVAMVQVQRQNGSTLLIILSCTMLPWHMLIIKPEGLNTWYLVPYSFVGLQTKKADIDSMKSCSQPHSCPCFWRCGSGQYLWW